MPVQLPTHSHREHHHEIQTRRFNSKECVDKTHIIQFSHASQPSQPVPKKTAPNRLNYLHNAPAMVCVIIRRRDL